jgi:excisionase family DNA binding protein
MEDKMTYDTGDRLISVREAAKLCRRNAETVRRWIWSGKLPAQKLGNQLFIKLSDLDSFYHLPGQKLTAKVRETAVENYKTKPGDRANLIKKMRKLRQEIRARVGNLDVDETIEQMREERLNELTHMH